MSSPDQTAMSPDNGVEFVGKDLDYLAQEGGAIGLGVGIEEGEVGELGHPVDRQEQEDLALRQAQLADVDVHVTDPGLGEALALGRLLLAFGQAGDVMTDSPGPRLTGTPRKRTSSAAEVDHDDSDGYDFGRTGPGRADVPAAQAGGGAAAAARRGPGDGLALARGDGGGADRLA